jgi:hypothetical protein
VPPSAILALPQSLLPQCSLTTQSCACSWLPTLSLLWHIHTLCHVDVAMLPQLVPHADTHTPIPRPRFEFVATLEHSARCVYTHALVPPLSLEPVAILATPTLDLWTAYVSSSSCCFFELDATHPQP